MKVRPAEEVNASNNQQTDNSKDNTHPHQDISLRELMQKISELDKTLNQNVTNSEETKTGIFNEEKVPAAINYVEPKSNKTSSGIRTREIGYSLPNIQKFDSLNVHTYRTNFNFLSYSFHMPFWI